MSYVSFNTRNEGGTEGRKEGERKREKERKRMSTFVEGGGKNDDRNGNSVVFCVRLVQRCVCMFCVFVSSRRSGRFVAYTFKVNYLGRQWWCVCNTS